MTVHSTSRAHFLAITSALALAITAAAADTQPGIAPEEAVQIQRVEGLYVNPWFTADPAPPFREATSTAFFGGASACQPPACPHPGRDTSIQLAAVSFGQPFAATVPYGSSPVCDTERGQTDCTFIGDAVWRAREMLYYSAAHSDSGCIEDPGLGVYCREQAAFRYKEILYDSTTGSPANRIEARLSSMSDFYGGAERARSLDAERTLRNALKYAPESRELRNALLDLYYDRAVAELTLAKEKLVDVAWARIKPPPDGGFVIDNEIAAYESILGDPAVPGGYRYALQGYFELLRDPLGVDVASIDPATADGRPFGYYIFQREVPQRSLFAASYLDEGTLTPVLDDDGDGEPDQLFAGFKDLVMLFDVLGDYGRAAAELARMYVMRAKGSDIVDAKGLIAEAHQKLYLEGTLLLEAFGPGELPAAGSASGLVESVSEWRHQMAELQKVRDFIRGDANLLGFADDFLMLAQDTGTGGGSGDACEQLFGWSTYDQLRVWMADPTYGSLTRALETYNAARASYVAYQGHQDQLATQFADRQTPYRERLRKIVGVEPGESGYDSPEENEGSEIWQQLQSIEVARNRITMNDTRLQNLVGQIQIEVDRRGKERDNQNAMSLLMIDYGDKQSKLTEQIAMISAVQAASNAAAKAGESLLSSLGTSLFTSPGNAAVQFACEIAKGQLSAQKERLAAEERATINDMQSQILDVNSEAQIKTWWLQARVIGVESLEATLMLGQEIGRLKELYDEKAAIERDMVRENEVLADRYFADPVHLLRMQSDMIAAEQAFDEAQKWLFFAVRAFEYKWNETFVHSLDDRTYSLKTLYRLRNAEELNQMAVALANKNALMQSNARDDDYSWFSVREDFFGYRYLVDGQVKYYEDPDTGELLDGIHAFRRELKRRMDSSGYITIDFSTVREKPGGSFFLGPRYDAAGNLVSAGTWLDKILWLKINLPGSHTTGQPSIPGYLTYGGVSYVRTQDIGTTVPNHPDLVEGEMTAWPTRYWYYHGTQDDWRSSAALTAPVAMQLSYNPQVPPSVAEINVFKERSVATTGWRLVIPTLDPTPVLNIDELNDIEIYFYHCRAVRPMARKSLQSGAEE